MDGNEKTVWPELSLVLLSGGLKREYCGLTNAEGRIACRFGLSLAGKVNGGDPVEIDGRDYARHPSGCRISDICNIRLLNQAKPDFPAQAADEDSTPLPRDVHQDLQNIPNSHPIQLFGQV